MQQIHINSREARAKWRELLDLVHHQHSEIIIERYGKPIAKLVSIEESRPYGVIKEMAATYHTTGFQPMSTPFEPQLRLSILKQLEAMPEQMLQTVQQLLAALAPAPPAKEALPVQSLPAQAASQWVGLLRVGYEGDALADSEALYE